MKTNPDFFAANMALLQIHQPHIWQRLHDTPVEPVGNICRAENGSPNLSAINSDGQEISLHKTSEPESEADDFLAQIPENHTGFVALLGMGLGYAAMGILEKRPLLQHLAVFELEPGIFLQAIKHIDLSPLLTDPRLILGVGTDISADDVLAPASRTLQLEGSRVLHHLQSFQFNHAGYKNLKEELFSHLNSLNVGGTTTRALGRDFFNNRFKHITTIHHHLLLEKMRNKFTGVPAILVAGGPSLDKNIHLLKQAQDKALILAVDTVLPSLLKHGISPHFLTSIDPNNLTYEKFADVISMVRDTSLICSSWVNPKTPQNFPGQQVFWTFTQKPMEAWLNTLVGGELFTSGASTVAHLNLIATDILGCDPIIFVGQDLAYPKTASHAQGTVLQGNAPTDVLNDTDREGQTVIGIDGTTLRTNRSFLSMKEFFEGAIRNSEKKYINATEGGAHIEGTTPLSLQETIDTYCKNETSPDREIKEYIKSATGINPGKLNSEFSKALKECSKLKKTIQEADKLAGYIRKEIRSAARNLLHVQSFNMLPPQIQQKVKKIDTLHKKLDNSWIWCLLEEITMDGLQESERARQSIATLANDPTKYLEWLAQNLTRLLKINSVRKETLGLLVENLRNTLEFHKQEKSLLNKIATGKDKAHNQLNLADLYMEGGNYILALPLLKELEKTMPQSGEVFFALGCIKALQAEVDNSAEYFSKATTIAPDLAAKVAEFHLQLADEFLGYAEYFKTQPGRRPSVIYMVKKGLQFAPRHPKLLNELEILVNDDMQQYQREMAEESKDKAAKIIKPWYEFMHKQNVSAINIKPELCSLICLNHGTFLAKEERYTEALIDFKKGLTYTPDDHDLNRSLIDTLFVTDDFNGAIEALNTAITIDNEFAGYWEVIGDNLLANEQHDDAILAYERCFTLQPNNSSLIKKIGDCYGASGQLEAAKAAYEQFKIKIQQSADLPKNSIRQAN